MTGAEEMINNGAMIAQNATDMATPAMDVVTQTVANTDMSMIALFAQASVAVKLVVIILILASFWCWTITFAKCSLLKKLKRKADKFEDAFWNCGSIENFFDRVQNTHDDPLASVFIAGMKEWHKTKSKTGGTSAIATEARISSIMSVAANREMEAIENHVGFLANVGAMAPFVGLFGTICGVMNTFEAIGVSQNTSLASVGPGIAEALFATALGLIVTIPAVFAYNKISADINKYQNRLDGFIDEFSAIISRQLEDTEA
jgi:biopolymer transport protein TolQ